MRHWRGWLLLVALAFFILMNRHSDSTPTASAHPSPEAMPNAAPLPEAPLPEMPVVQLPEAPVVQAKVNRVANSHPHTVLEKPLESAVR